MLNLFLFTNAHFEIGDIFSDWGNNWSQKVRKWQYRIQKNSLKITLRKKKRFWQQPCKMQNYSHTSNIDAITLCFLCLLINDS